MHHFILKVDVNGFDFEIDKEEFESSLWILKNDLFEGNELKKENAKYLTKYFNDLYKSIWIAFYNSKIEELKGYKKDKPLNTIYPFKEIENYNVFLKYAKLHIVEPYLDYSYLYQRLLEKEFIEYIKQKDFIFWLFDNDFINKKDFDLFDEKGQFYSLRKSTTPTRENNFNNLFKL
jgi:hypothetical protein